LQGTRIDRFDLKGKHINSFNVGAIKESNLSICGFIKPDLLIASKPFPNKIGVEVLILEINNNFRVKNRFIFDRTGDTKLSEGTSIGVGAGVVDENIVVSSILAYEINFYTVYGKEVKKIKKNVRNLYLAYFSKNGTGVAGSISIPRKINSSYYLSILTGPSNVTEMSQLENIEYKKEYATTIDIFNEEGMLVYTKQYEGRTNPEIGRPIYSDSEGYLYTFKELPYPQICKYQVIISDKK
jgi:hypothetical protein